MVLKSQLNTILDGYDHDVLNSKPGLANPTAEIIAKDIYDTLHVMTDMIEWVEVWESEDAGVRYEPEHE